MPERFSEELIERAWTRSKGKCECEYRDHDHTGKCDRMLIKVFRGDRMSEYGWEPHSISGRYLDNLADCTIMCLNPCYRLYESSTSDLFKE